MAVLTIRLVVGPRYTRFKALAQKLYAQIPDWCHENRDWLYMFIGGIVAVLATWIVVIRFLS
jgi:hypothetical protein